MKNSVRLTLLSVIFSSPAIAQSQFCEAQASRAVKTNYPQIFQKDFEGRMRYIASSSCQSHAQFTNCQVLTGTVDSLEVFKFSVILSKDCSELVDLRLEMNH